MKYIGGFISTLVTTAILMSCVTPTFSARSSEGDFRGLKWGATKAQVIAREGADFSSEIAGNSGGPALVYLRDALGMKNVSVNFDFAADGSLARCDYIVGGADQGFYDRILQALEAKYGKSEALSSSIRGWLVQNRTVIALRSDGYLISVIYIDWKRLNSENRKLSDEL
jgi:hypothetical protein